MLRCFSTLPVLGLVSSTACAEAASAVLPPIPQVEFSPSLQTLAGVVNDIGSHLFSTISVFRHLPEILIRSKFQRDPIHVIVGEWAVGRAPGAGASGARRVGLGGAGRRGQGRFRTRGAGKPRVGVRLGKVARAEGGPRQAEVGGLTPGGSGTGAEVSAARFAGS